MGHVRGDRGQASVELFGALPVLGVLALAGWQLVVIGESWWLAGVGARAAARAEVVGADAQGAARSALPGGWGPRMTVHNGMDGQLVVRVRVPLVVGGGALGTVGADVATPDGGS